MCRYFSAKLEYPQCRPFPKANAMFTRACAIQLKGHCGDLRGHSLQLAP